MTSPATAPGPLRLSLDVSAVPVEAVGAGRYILDLATALGERPDVAMTLWCRRGDAARWHRLAPRATVAPAAPGRRPARLAWEQARLPALLRRAPVELHHGPHYTMPERARLPRVVTIHDCTFLEHPEWHERSKVLVLGRAIRVAARRADALVCVSQHTAERLEALCRPTGRLFVVPHGVDHDRFRPAAGPAVPAAALGASGARGAGVGGDSGDEQRDDDAWLEALGIRVPYVLFLGTLEPRKAVPDLVAAFDRVAGEVPELSLVLAGQPGWGEEAVAAAVERARARHRIVRTGYVPDGAVPALLRRSAVVAYPALEEGFGLPALEALACGAPLVTTAGTTMAELAAGAATLVAPGSVPALADALGEALSGGPEVERRRRLGLEVASRHTWAASAEGHVAAYRWALRRAGQPSRGGAGPDR